MQFQHYLSATALLCLLNTAASAEATLNDQVQAFALQPVRDAQRLLAGLKQPEPIAIEPNLSCTELYRQRLNLVPNLSGHNPTYWNDPRNQTAVFLGVIWTPAFYFLGYSAIDARLRELDGLAPRAELDALRYASAEQRCFQK